MKLYGIANCDTVKKARAFLAARAVASEFHDFKKLGVAPHKIMVTLAHHGNTSAASIPLALNQAFEEHRLKEGDLVLMEAMGGGFTWGAVLARW